jgi:hypothetical protein
MKKQLKKMLNVALLLSLIILSSCEKDLYDEAIVQDKKGISTKRISLKELDSKTNAELFKAASRVKNKVENLAGRMVYDSIYDFYFDDEKGIYLNKDGKESYTFPIYRKNSDDKIENIIFNEKDNGEFDILLSKYDIKREDLEGLTVEELNSTLIEYTALFDGNRSLAPQLVCVDTESYQLVSDNAGGIPTQQPLMHYEWVTTGSYCFWTGGPGGGGGGGYEESTTNGGVPGGQNNSSTGGSGGMGVNTALNSGYTLAQYNFVNSLSTSNNVAVQDNFVTIDSGAQNIILNYIEANKTNTALINTVQYFIRNTNLAWLGLQTPSVQTSIMNYVVHNNFSSTSRDFINQTISNMSVNNYTLLNLNNFDNNITTTNVPQCLQNLVNSIKLLQNGKFGQVISQFAGNNPVPQNYNWNVTIGTLGYNNPANTTGTVNANTQTVTSTINSSYLNTSTNLSLVKTLIHECFHAYLVSVYRYRNIDTSYVNLLNTYYSQFNNNSNDAHHHFFAQQNIVNEIATAILEYGINNGYPNLTLQYCQDLAWSGLQGTNAYNNLPISDQERIQSVLFAEFLNSNTTPENILGLTPVGVPVCP